MNHDPRKPQPQRTRSARDGNAPVPSRSNKNININNGNRDDQDLNLSAKLMLLQVDPLVRMILALLGQYQTMTSQQQPAQQQRQVSSPSQQQTPLLTTRSRRETIMGLLQTLDHLMQRYQQTWKQLVETILTTEDQMLAAMEQLQDYVFLPIMAIVRTMKLEWTYSPPSSAPNEQQTQDNDNDNDDDNSLRIQCSAKRLCVQRAAEALISMVSKDDLTTEGEADAGKDTMSRRSCVLKNSVIVSLLTACAMALPSGQEWSDRHNGKGQDFSLDSGHACIQALLRAMQCWIFYTCNACSKLNTNVTSTSGAGRLPDNTQPNDNRRLMSTSSVRDSDQESMAPSAVVAIAQAMEGALVARMVDCCLGLVEFSPLAADALPLEALKTIQVLLISIPLAKTWQSIFPGLFAGLYKTSLKSMRVVRRSSRLAVQSTTVLMQLLQVAVVPLAPTMPFTVSSSLTSGASITYSESNNVTSMLQSLSSLAMQTRLAVIDHNASRVDNARSAIPEPPPQTKTFAKQVNEKIPATLTLLVHLLTGAQISVIRTQALDLDRLLLLELARCWIQPETAEHLAITALDSCLMLAREGIPEQRLWSSLSEQNDSAIAAKAQRILDELVSGQNGCTNLAQWVAPRIITMLHELPLWVHRSQQQQENEMTSKMKLLAGYFTIMSNAAKVWGPKHPATRSFRDGLGAEPMATAIREALSTLLDVDFEEQRESTASNGPVAQSIVELTTLQKQITVQHQQSTQAPSCLRAFGRRFVRDGHATHAALDMIQMLGHCLGPKQATLWADSCLADLYESCCHRQQGRQSLFQHGQVQWVHEWIGSIAVIQELLRGALTKVDQRAAHERTRHKPRLAKRIRHLKIFASSSLALIVSDPLWSIPTSWAPATANRPKGHHDKIATYHGAQRMDTTLVRETIDDDSVVPCALRGNLALLIELLQLVGTIFELLGSEGRDLLPLVLYPILEKATCETISTWMNDQAASTLIRMAQACGYSNVGMMMIDNIEILIGGLLGRLRVPGGNVPLGWDFTAKADPIIAAATATIGILRFTSQVVRTMGDMPTMLDDLSILVRLEEVTDELLLYFDHASLSSRRGTHNGTTTLVFVRLFIAAISYLDAHYVCQHPIHVRDKAQQTIGAIEPWLALLMNCSASIEVSQGDKQAHNETSTNGEAPVPSGSKLTKWNRQSLMHDTDYVGRLASRCCYLLSHPDLRIQIESAEALKLCFQFLGWIAMSPAFSPCEGDEPNGPSTAILRQVHTSWPAISARLQALSMVVSVPERTRRGVIVLSDPMDLMRVSSNAVIPEQRYCLAKLMEVMGVISIAAGDFIASRFRLGVWPAMERILASFIIHPASKREQTNNGDTALYNGLVKRVWSESELELLVGTLRCIGAVFRTHATGVALGGLIPTIGHAIFPFLDLDNRAEPVAVHTIQELLRVDSDALLRPLLQWSGIGLSPTPFSWIPSDADNSNNKQECALLRGIKRPPSTRIAKTAKRLIEFIEDLPEQDLE